MINRNIAAFCAAFESVLASTNDVEKAIEIECSMDNQNEFDYDC